MQTFRICDAPYADDTMSGRGAFLYGGRWSSPGRHVTYVSGNVTLAMLEVLVHVDDVEAFRRRRHVYHDVRFDESHVAVLEKRALPRTWRSRPETTASQAVGDEWLERETSVVLAVPSVIVPEPLRYEWIYMNYLINPYHPAYPSAVEAGAAAPLDWDPRR